MNKKKKAQEVLNKLQELRDETYINLLDKINKIIKVPEKDTGMVMGAFLWTFFVETFCKNNIEERLNIHSLFSMVMELNIKNGIEQINDFLNNKEKQNV